jgi:hypothetical protein
VHPGASLFQRLKIKLKSNLNLSLLRVSRAALLRSPR